MTYRIVFMEIKVFLILVLWMLIITFIFPVLKVGSLKINPYCVFHFSNFQKKTHFDICMNKFV